MKKERGFSGGRGLFFIHRTFHRKNREDITARNAMTRSIAFSSHFQLDLYSLFCDEHNRMTYVPLEQIRVIPRDSDLYSKSEKNTI